MFGLVHRRLGLGVCIALIVCAFGPAGVAREIGTSARFTVAIGGLRAGVFWLDGRSSARDYAVSAGFTATGMIGGLTQAEVSMTAQGQIGQTGFSPQLYQETVRLGRRMGAITIDYGDGAPGVTGQKLRDRRGSVPVTPAEQAGTLDPLTAIYAMLRRQPLADACQIDRFIFDGERRTRLIMSDLVQEGAEWVCTGQFLRLEGYSARDLRRSGPVDVTVRYQRAGKDLVATEAWFASLRGVVRVTRR